jgi:CMP-N,N'-diacetyllegionaminic acid synthase
MDSKGLICTICARGGSKGVKNKNVRMIAGKPLIAHSIETAKKSGLFAGVGVSSDSKEILDAAKQAGADWLIERPAELATDTAAKIPVIRHAAQEIEKIIGRKVDVVVDLDATSPLRTVDDLHASLKMFLDSGAPNLITAMPSRRSPYFNLIERNEQGRWGTAKKLPAAIVRRQDAPACFDMNASIYIWKKSVLDMENSVFLDGTQLYEMPESRSVDIDTPLDFEIVEFLLKRQLNL